MLTEQFTKIYAPWVALLALVGSLIVALVQYEHSKYVESVARVLDLAKEYRTQFQKQAIEFEVQYDWYDAHVIAAALRDKKPPTDCAGKPRGESKLYACLIGQFLSDEQNRNDYEALKFFFDSLSVCVNSGLCDFGTAQSFFGSDTLAFSENMYPWILRQQQRGDNATDLLAFAGKLRAAEKSSAPSR